MTALAVAVTVPGHRNISWHICWTLGYLLDLIVFFLSGLDLLPMHTGMHHSCGVCRTLGSGPLMPVLC